MWVCILRQYNYYITQAFDSLLTYSSSSEFLIRKSPLILQFRNDDSIFGNEIQLKTE